MGFILITVFAICVVNVSSKVQVEGVQAETIRLKLRGIASDKGNEYGLEGESTWYCQRMREKDNDGSSQTTNPIYFVQPQSKKHKHSSPIEGQPSKSDTTIYVLPPKNSHEIEIDTAENGAAVSKPMFFFLKNHPYEVGNSHSQRSVSSVSISATSSLAPPLKEYPSIHRNLKRNRTSTHRRSQKAIS